MTFQVRALGLLATPTLVLALALACGDDDAQQSTPTSTSTAAASPTTAQSTPSATATATTGQPSATATTPPATGTAATPSARACTLDDLSLELLPAGAAAGTHFLSLAATNRSATTCTVQGYPGASLVDGAGKQLGAAAGRNPAIDAVPVPLAPGQAAHTLVGFPTYQNFGAGVCAGPSASLLVYPPGETRSATLALVDYACPGFAVRAFEPGRNEPGR